MPFGKFALQLSNQESGMLRRRLPFSLTVAAALTLLGGLAVTAVLFVSVIRLEYDNMALSFQQRAGVRVVAVRRGLEEAVEVLTVTNQLFATVFPVTREQFHDFTAPLLQRYPFIRAFHFHRLVKDTERTAVESALQAIRPGTVITEPGARGLVPAPRHAWYSIVDYLEPMAGNEAAFGLNVATNPEVMAALERSGASGHAAATGLISLAQESIPQASFELLMPVYRPHSAHHNAAERRAALIGNTAAVIRGRALVNTILHGAGLLDDPGIMLTVHRWRERQSRAPAVRQRCTCARLAGASGPARRPGRLARAG
jgi:CHASE1-domain containing sensor protein